MKISNKFFIAGLTALSLLMNGCADSLNTEPKGSTVTSQQRDDVLQVTPDRLSAGVQGIYAWMIEYNTAGSGDHSDFGYPAWVLMSELWGQDMAMTGNTYGWFWNDQVYTNRAYTGRDNFFIWNFFYRLIGKANDVIVAISPEETDPLFLAFAGQAKAMRAWAYFHLVQLYQHTYVGHEDSPAVPIVTDQTTRAQAFNNPRATVNEVYRLILDDLDYAITNLDGYSRSLKVEVDQNVAYGILARVYLTMERWSDAAEAAHNASSGYTPMNGATYNDEKTGFNSIDNPAWMWGSKVEEINRVVTSGIVNYPSHLGSLNYGYAWAGDMFKAISANLYDMISDTDIRKKAFIGDHDSVFIAGLLELPPFANIKFRPYQGVLLQETNANDWSLMRVEEMILIEAEALAMSGQTGNAVNLLNNFMQSYRDPNYICPVSDAAGIQLEVWKQRRIELWGEGFAWFDLKRLRQGTNRTFPDTNFLDDAQINLPPEHGLFLLRIPQRELQNNIGIGEAANNPIAVAP